MKNARGALLLTFAALGGLLDAEALYRWAGSRDAIVDFAARHWLGPDAARDFVLRKNLHAAASDEPVAEEELERELALVRFQFADEAAFARAREAAGYSDESLRAHIGMQLRARQWIEKQIASEFEVTQEEMRQSFEENREQFLQPQRYRASHAFLAAPAGTAPEVIAEKQSMIQGLAVRMLAGENLAALAGEASEDEATKPRGGDLSYFSAARLPAEFMAEVEKMQVGEHSAPVQSRLGFHIVRLIDAKPPRALSFEEARGEIAAALANEKRATAVGRLIERLAL